MVTGYWQLTVLALVPAVVVASIIDYRAHKVPNWLNALLAAGGIAAQGWFFGWSGVGNAVLGILVGLGVLAGQAAMKDRNGCETANSVQSGEILVEDPKQENSSFSRNKDRK